MAAQSYADDRSYGVELSIAISERFTGVTKRREQSHLGTCRGSRQMMSFRKLYWDFINTGT